MRALVLAATLIAALVGLASLQLLAGVARRVPLEHRSRRPVGPPRPRTAKLPADLAQLERLAEDALRGDRVALDHLARLLAATAARAGVADRTVDRDAARSPAGLLAALDAVEAAAGLGRQPRPAGPASSRRHDRGSG